MADRASLIRAILLVGNNKAMRNLLIRTWWKAKYKKIFEENHENNIEM
jgi:hypothetical protein